MTKGIAEQLLYFTVAMICTNQPNTPQRQIRNTSAMDAATSSSGMVMKRGSFSHSSKIRVPPSSQDVYKTM